MTFFLTLLFMFLVFWRPQEWLVPGMYGWPVLDVVVCISLLTFVLEADLGRVRSPLKIPQVHLLFWLWIATMMSHIANTYFAGLAETWFETFKFCLFSVLLVSVLDRIGRLRAVAALFVGMAIVMSIHALMQERTGLGFAGQPPVWGNRPGQEDPVSRSQFFGIFGDPNDMAQMLAVSIPFVFALPVRFRWFHLPVAVGISWLLIQAIGSTWSRGGEMALYVALAFLALMLLPARWLPKLGVLALPASLLMFPLGAGLLEQSARDRVVFWGEANYAFKAKPLFGVGYGMLGEYIGGGRAAHNAFVMCYAELGVFGYIFWFVLSFFAFAGAWQTQTRLAGRTDVDSIWLRRFAGLSMAALTSYFASSYFLSRAYMYPYFFLVAIGGCLPAIADRLTATDTQAPIWTPETIRKWLIWGAMGALGSIVYIYCSILLLNKAYGG
jgi:putative inorganic carbon (HCO3(-)) transporter